MTRRVRKSDWEARCQHLADSRDYITQARADKGRRHVLDRAVWCVWQFGEFAIDVCLELQNKESDVHHAHPQRAKELFEEGMLTADYSRVLEQQNEYRLRAEHGVYSRGGASVHYSPKNVEDCLAEMERLRDEVEALLRKHKRL